MTIENIRKPLYKTIGQPTLECLTFTCSSKEDLNLPQAIKYCVHRNSILQAAHEGIGFRIAAAGTEEEEEANQLQITRTACVGVAINGKKYLAFDDDRDAKRNILLARAQAYDNAIQTRGYWRLPMKDKHIKDILARAEKSGRIVECPTRDNWPVAQHDGVSVYGTQPIVKAALCDQAEPNAAFLAQKGFKAGYMFTDDPIEGKAEVWVVDLGSVGDRALGYVSANEPTDFVGRARGVRERLKR